MDYTTWTVPTQVRVEDKVVVSLYEALQGLADPRHGQGKRYPLAVILSLLFLAKLAGQTTLRGSTVWVRHRRTLLTQRFGLSREDMPCQTTYSNVLGRIDAHEFDAIISAFLIRWEAQNRCGDEPSRLQMPSGQADHRHLAIDGKTPRATTSQSQPAHQLSCYEVDTGIVLWHCNVGEKENEISALKPLLTPHLVKGRIFILDVMHSQRALCAQIHRLQGDYLLIVKDNQPTLREDIADLFEDPCPDQRRGPQAETWDKAHGRLEHRHLTSSPDLNDWFGKQWEDRTGLSDRAHDADPLK